MKRVVKCPTCGRVLGKVDDCTFHVKLGRDGPQVFFQIDETFNPVMLICPSVVYTPKGKVNCGSRHEINKESLQLSA